MCVALVLILNHAIPAFSKTIKYAARTLILCHAHVMAGLTKQAVLMHLMGKGQEFRLEQQEGHWTI